MIDPVTNEPLPGHRPGEFIRGGAKTTSPNPMTENNRRILAGCIVAAIIVIIAILFSGCESLGAGVYVETKHGNLTYTLPRPSGK